jgi:pimeloyl-ACP methyl ester carboxylesterase
MVMKSHRMTDIGGIALLLCACVAPALAGDDPEWTVEIVQANPAAGFNFPYVLRTPADGSVPERRYLVVESNNTGADDDFEHHLAGVRSFASGPGIGPTVARELGTPLLVPVFPRSKQEWWIYTHALDRDSMLLGEQPRHRLDLQLLNMVEDARQRLKERGVILRERFVLVGFSASGTFSNRFAFLHPDTLAAVVSGAVNSFPMLPVESVGGKPFTYPLGVADFEEITGTGFDADAWRELPQMIFMGAIDDNDAVKFDDAYSEEERNAIFSSVGEDMSARWQASQLIYSREKPNVTFITYGGVGHWTDGRIMRDILNFVNTTMRQQAADDDK